MNRLYNKRFKSDSGRVCILASPSSQVPAWEGIIGAPAPYRLPN